MINVEITFFAGLSSEEIYPKVEKKIQYENIEKQKKRRERQWLHLLKEEFDNLKTEPTFLPTHHVQSKENNLEDVAVEK